MEKIVMKDAKKWDFNAKYNIIILSMAILGMVLIFFIMISHSKVDFYVGKNINDLNLDQRYVRYNGELSRLEAEWHVSLPRRGDMIIYVCPDYRITRFIPPYNKVIILVANEENIITDAVVGYP